jgi:hypothetical protein
MRLKLDELETNINMTGDDRSKWILVSDDPVMINKLNKISIGTKLNNSTAYEYTLDASQISIKKKRVLTEDQKRKSKERLLEGRSKKIKT